MTAYPAFTSAVQLLDDGGDGPAMLSAARALRDAFVRGDHIIGLLPPAAPDVLAAIYRSAGEAGEVDAWLELGHLLVHGAAPHAPYPPSDTDAAVDAYRRADAAGSFAGALGWIRTAYFARSTAYSEQAVVRLDDLLAERPNSPELLLLKGYFAHQGYGGPADRAGAVDWHRRAAEHGSADAAFELAVLYATGDGVDQDPDESLRWTVKAAELGSARAMSNLGGMYATGRGVPQDPDLAVDWYGKAARAGHPQAAYTAGVMHLIGDGGLPVDATKAAEFFETAEVLGFDVDRTLASMGLERPED